MFTKIVRYRRAGLVAAIALPVATLIALGGYRIGQANALEIAAGHLRSRSGAILSAAAQRPWEIVVLGDSVVELADLSRLCGDATLNAGVAGARVADVEQLAENLLPLVRPRLILISVGTNDSWRHDPTDPHAFRASYYRLIRMAEDSGARVVLLTPPPIGYDGKPKARIFDAAVLDEHRGQVRMMRRPVIDEFAALADANGRMSDAHTADGAHPNARGYAIWEREADRACGMAATPAT